jgi:tetratricopeptide (TPR) repeat protein
MKNLFRKAFLIFTVILFVSGYLLPDVKDSHAQQTVYEAAVASAQRILQKNPDNFNALMILGDAYLNLKKGPEAVATLEQAHRLDPDSLRAAPNLGLAYMMTGENGKAISTWRAYTKKYPNTWMASRLRKQTTVLLHIDAAKWAKTAARREEALQPTSIDENVLAVTGFGDQGMSEEAKPLRKALAAMIITDLTKVKALKVVERIKLQKLLDELRFGASGIVDEKTAPRLGRMLGAGKIVTGSMTSVDKDDLRVVRMLRNVSTGKDLGDEDAQGRLKEFFRIQKTLTFGILKNMGIRLTKEEETLVGKYATRSFEAVKLYGAALAAEDRGDWDEASRLYGLCAEADPQSPLADIARSTPTKADAQSDAGRIKAAIVAAAALDSIQMGRAGSEGESTLLASPVGVSDVTSPVMTAAASGTSAQTPDTSTVTQDQVTQSASTPIRPVTHEGYSIGQITETDSFGMYTHYYVYDTPSTASFDTDYIKSSSPTMTIQGLPGSSPILTALEAPGDIPTPISSGLPAAITRVELGYNAYQEWGYWTQPNSMSYDSFYSYSFDTPSYYVWGDRTSDANMSSLTLQNITGTYTGKAYGTYTWGDLGSTVANMSGNFSTSVDFGAGTLSDFNINVSGGGHSAIISVPGVATEFSGNSSPFNISSGQGTWTVDGSPASVGTASGSFYGSSAQAIGGKWKMTSGSFTNATGIFQGTR